MLMPLNSACNLHHIDTLDCCQLNLAVYLFNLKIFWCTKVEFLTLRFLITSELFIRKYSEEHIVVSCLCSLEGLSVLWSFEINKVEMPPI